MRDKLIFALDVENRHIAATYIEELSEYVGCFKVGLELFIKEGPYIFDLIRAICPDPKIFLDLKLHDIPATVHNAIKIASSHDIDYLSVHSRRNIDMHDYNGVKILAITVLTSEPTAVFAVSKAEIAKLRGAYGVVCSGWEVEDIKAFVPGIKCIVPGIRPWGLEVPSDDQHRVMSAQTAIKKGADMIVVGRPIRDADNPRQAARTIIQDMEAA